MSDTGTPENYTNDYHAEIIPAAEPEPAIEPTVDIPVDVPNIPAHIPTYNPETGEFA